MNGRRTTDCAVITLKQFQLKYVLRYQKLTFGPNAIILRTHSTENMMVNAEFRKINVLQ